MILTFNEVNRSKGLNLSWEGDIPKCSQNTLLSLHHCFSHTPGSNAFRNYGTTFSSEGVIQQQWETLSTILLFTQSWLGPPCLRNHYRPYPEYYSYGSFEHKNSHWQHNSSKTMHDVKKSMVFGSKWSKVPKNRG